MMLTIHTALGVVALLAGAWNFASAKGTRRHRTVGYVYAGSMGGLLLTSFGIYEVFGGFGPFHIMSVVSGVALLLALYFPLRRHRHANWLAHHYMWMGYSYVGLVMATGSHLFQYGPAGWSFWARAGLYWGLPYVVGTILIFWRRDRLLRRLHAHEPVDA